MGLGLEQALAEFIAAELGHGLYDDPDPARRVVFVMLQPPVPESEAPPPDSGETTAALAITVFPDGGPPPESTRAETQRVTVQTRHRSYERAMAEARLVHDLLHEQGGTSPRAGSQGRFGALRVLRIRAEFVPTYLGRDPAPRDGRALVTQSFTVRLLAPVTIS